MCIDLLGDLFGTGEGSEKGQTQEIETLVATMATAATDLFPPEIPNIFPNEAATISATMATQSADVDSVVEPQPVASQPVDTSNSVALQQVEVVSEAVAAQLAKVDREHAALIAEAKAKGWTILQRQPELPRLHSGMLMTDQTSGKPLHCVCCGRRRQVAGSAWWVGVCDICGERKGVKSRCSVVCTEWV